MKNTTKIIVAAALVLTMLFCIVSCGEKKTVEGLWSTALYTENTTLGEGAKTITVEVTAEEKTVVFTVKTDAATVGEALMGVNLLAGEEGPYGLYIKSVNGMIADFDVDQTYWAFNIGGEYAMTGVDQTEITEGTVYQLVRTK